MKNRQIFLVTDLAFLAIALLVSCSSSPKKKFQQLNHTDSRFMKTDDFFLPF